MNLQSFFNILPILLIAQFSLAHESHRAIVATSFPVWSVLNEILPAGMLSQKPLLQAGSSPHTHDVKPSHAKKIHHAKALFAVAPNMESWVHSDPTKQFYWIEGLNPNDQIKINNQIDPHFWLDPIAVKNTLPKLEFSLCKIMSNHCNEIKQKVSRFSSQLDKLHGETNSLLEKISFRSMSLSHPFFIYFLNRYNIKVSFIVHKNPTEHVGPKSIKRFLNQANQQKPNLLLTLKQKPTSNSAVQLISKQSNTPILVLDPVGGSKETKDYFSLIRWNRDQIIGALESQ